MTRLWRGLVLASLALVWAGLPAGSGAQEPAFAQFAAEGTGTAAIWTYDQPSANVPARPTGQFSSVYSQSQIDELNAYGLASVAWPGHVAASVPEFLWFTFWTSAVAGGYPPEFVPPVPTPTYPVRSESRFPQGPADNRNEPAGGMRMRTAASAMRSEGAAAADRSGFPNLGQTGSQTSETASFQDGDLVVSDARATASDIAVLGDLITIDSVRTRATATSDGRTGRVGGQVVVSGLRVAGHPMTIDESGIHAEGQNGDPGATVIVQNANAALAAAGVSMTLAGPTDLIEGPRASRSIGGLIIRFSSAAVGEYLGALPAELRNEIDNIVAFDQAVTLQLAGAAVAAGASPYVSYDTGGGFTGGTGVLGGGFTGTDAIGGGSTFGGPSGDGSDVTGPAASGGGPRDGSGAPASFPLTDGVPLALTGLIAFGALGTSRILARAAEAALAARTAARCMLSENG